MSTPRVSIILPFLNAGAAFPPALRSILQQSHQDWELLLCDDGSTDGSLELARSLDDPRVVVWSDGRTKGLAGRLNECIDRARGAYIARMDADDISYPDRIRLQLEFLEQHPEIDVVGCRMLICGEGQLRGKRPLLLEHEQRRKPGAGFRLGASHVDGARGLVSAAPIRCNGVAVRRRRTPLSGARAQPVRELAAGALRISRIARRLSETL
jgi:glycosyltransferase involved in cell wall biosynthesis